jgi:ubiquinone/menaquinone biosynthesis C-methylase UbiE
VNTNLLDQIPKANTQKGVTRQVFLFLQKYLQLNQNLKLIDVPCGEGHFSNFLMQQFPQLQIHGVDFYAKNPAPKFHFYALKAHDYFLKHSPQQIDAICCISGVMCFDGIPDLFSQFQSCLKPDGLVIITNDNIMTIRDRIHFVMFGSFKRFRLMFSEDQGNWNVLLPQALWMHLRRQNLEVLDVRYTSIYSEDWIFLPLALLLYPIFWLYMMTAKGPMPKTIRRKFFGFSSLLARHYVIVAQKYG